MTATRFHPLTVKRISPEAAGSLALTFDIPAPQRETFAFEPGQFLTLRAQVDGQELRRTYSICSPRSRLQQQGEIEIGIRPVPGGVFSNWAASAIRVGDALQVLPPEGSFTVKKTRAIHRVGFAAGSGITPILSIAASTLQEQPESKFTLVFGNRRMASVMFNEALQDLKDTYPSRFTMIHILSRQAQEVDLLEGRIDRAKVKALVDTLLPARSMDEVFICGPEAMIEATQAQLQEAGVAPNRIYTERFTTSAAVAVRVQAERDAQGRQLDALKAVHGVRLELLLDGKLHELALGRDESVLDAALEAGLDLPYSCKSGVCCTCRAKVLEGQVVMQQNFGLHAGEVARGFVLTCQARALSERLRLSFDER